MEPRKNLIVMFIFLMGLSVAQAGMYDLVANTDVTVNNAVFFQTSQNAAGSGNIQSFVRIQNNGIEEGINIVPLIYDTKPGAFTNIVDVRYVNQVTYNFQLYREFFIDLSESGSDLLSLDSLKIYVEPTSNLTNYPAAFTNMIYDLDFGVSTADPEEGNWIKMLASGGNGILDVRFLIPEAYFPSSGYLYLYAKMGLNIAATDGFEEFDIDFRDTPIPEPASLLLFGLAGLVMRRRN